MTSMMTATESAKKEAPQKPPITSQAKPTEDSHRLIYADMLRAFAILQVIYVHCVSMFIPNLSQSASWWACLIPEVLGRASVPLFLMLSGMFLLQSKIESPFGFLQKRLPRLIIPLLVWSLIYLAWNQFQTGVPIRGSRILKLLQEPAYYHLGYLYFLTGLYLAVPILKNFVTVAKAKDFVYFICLWLVSTTAIPAFHKLTGVACSIQIVVATHYTGYFVAGYGLRNWVATKSSRRLVWLALVGSCLVAGAGTYLLTARNNGNFDPFLVESVTPAIFGYSVATFLLFKSWDWRTISEKHPLLVKAGKSVSDLSFSMYLLHPIVIDLCTRFGLHTIIPRQNFWATSFKMFVFATVAITATWSIVRLARLLRAPLWLVP